MKPPEKRELKMEDLPEALQELIGTIQDGEELVIVRGQRPVARLLPLPAEGPRPTFGSARGLVTMADDFDAPLEDFRDYM
jgi:antitoxin (DNA-binding transcriptional repressor) of toxin-antitoxin stability system